MRTLTIGHNPASRITAGDAVLAASKTIGIQAIAKRFGLFAKTHRSYLAAQKKVDAAEEKLRAAQARVGECDAEQDDAVYALATVLAGLGLPRTNPFRPLGFEAPSVIAKMGYGVEAKRVIELVAAIGKRKDLAKAVAASKRAKAGALSVQGALKKVPPLKKACDEARTAREALAQPWETAFGALKRAARAADDDGGTELFATLFERTAAPKGKRKRSAKGKGPAQGPVAAEAEKTGTAG